MPAWLQEQLPEGERMEFARHLRDCPVCQARCAAFADVLGRLRAAPGVEAIRLDDRVFARLPEEKRRVVPSWRSTALRVAAVLAGFLLAGLALWSVRQREAGSLAAATPAAPAPALPERAAAVSAALDWLVQTQSATGGWEAEKWGAQRNFTEGVTALSLLALMEDGPGLSDPRRGEAVRRGVTWLLERQNARGLFGPDCTGSMYNHGLATLALLEACTRERDEAWLAAARRAVGFIVDSQKTTGGCGGKCAGHKAAAAAPATQPN